MKQNILFSLVAGIASVTLTFAAGTLVLAARASLTASVEAVTLSGNAFYNGSEQLYIRGVDYQPGGGASVVLDPISNATACNRDIKYFTELGINTIRVYTVDNTADHDECMNALADARIYWFSIPILPSTCSTETSPRNFTIMCTCKASSPRLTNLQTVPTPLLSFPVTK